MEVSGSRKSPGPTKAKAETARNQWCAAINNWGEFGRWGYIEIQNPAQEASYSTPPSTTYMPTDHHRPSGLTAGNTYALTKEQELRPEPIEAITHADKRANLPTADAQDFVAQSLNGRSPSATRATRRSTPSWSGKARMSSTAKT